MKKIKDKKAEILKYIEKSNSFVCIFLEKDGNQVSYADYNITNADIITGCEVVKSKILKKVVVK